MTGLRGLGACGTFSDTPLICTWVQFRCCSVQHTPWRPRWPSFMSDYFHVHCWDITLWSLIWWDTVYVMGLWQVIRSWWEVVDWGEMQCSLMRSSIFSLNTVTVVSPPPNVWICVDASVFQVVLPLVWPKWCHRLWLQNVAASPWAEMWPQTGVEYVTLCTVLETDEGAYPHR